MPPGKHQQAIIENGNFGGVNTALQFSQIPKEQSPFMINACQTKQGAIGKRPGTIPISNTLAAKIERIIQYGNDLFVTSSNILYKLIGSTLTPQTMTNYLVVDNVYSVPFTDDNNNSILFITDCGSMKQYNGTEVKNIVPAANDTSPAPANDMDTLNGKAMRYCWVHSGHIFVSDGSDTIWYSKRWKYDYFPQVQFERFVNSNDYINGPGITFNNVCLIPMRRGWGVLFGSVFDDGLTSDGFTGNKFINTKAGCIAPKSISKITYPDGMQTLAYLSDDGVHEIYDTSIADTGSRQHSSRNLMRNKIDFTKLGLTDAEKETAIGYFDIQTYCYYLSIEKGTEYLTYVYDTRNQEWYPWTNLKVYSMIRKDNLYYVGEDKQVRKFDESLYTDWDDSGKTTGTPVYFKRYSPAYSLEFSGYPSFWDHYLLEMKRSAHQSSLDISVIFTDSTLKIEQAYQNENFIWGVSQWNVAKWVNPSYTDYTNEPNRLNFYRKSKYCQFLWENNRDEPIEIYKEKIIGRISGR